MHLEILSAEQKKLLSLISQFKRKYYLVDSYFNRKLFKGQLAYFTDIDYSEEVDFLPGFEVSEEDVKSFLIDIATQPF